MASFFRADPEYGPREYDTTDKIVPLSQTPSQEYSCELCARKFSTRSGRTNHQNKCKMKEVTSTVKNDTSTVTSTVPTGPSATTKPATENTEIPAVPHPVTNQQQQGESFEGTVNRAYEQMTRWSRNIFQLPKGKIGKEFVREMTTFITQWTSKSPLRSISLKLLMILPNLLLQKTTRKVKAKESIETLARRLSI